MNRPPSAKRVALAWVVLMLALPILIAAQERDTFEFANLDVTINPTLTLVIVYAEPGDDADISEALSGGVAVTLTGEAETLVDSVWWEVEPPSGRGGWLPETQDELATMLLEDGTPLSLNGDAPTVALTSTPAGTAQPSIISATGETVIVAVDLLLLYDDADSRANIVEALTRGLPLTILAASETIDSGVWWNVRSASGAEGYILGTFGGEPIFVNPALTGEVLARGGEAGISSDAFAIIYADPDPISDVIEAATSGVLLRIIDGPELIDGVRWWQVRLPSGGEGWTPETVDGMTVLVPPNAMFTPTPMPTAMQSASTFTPSVPPPMQGSGTFAIGNEVQIVSLEPDFPVRASPSMRASELFDLARSERATIIGGPQAISESEGGVPQNFTWWQIRTANGSEGWIQELYYGEPILILYNAANPIGLVICTLSTFRDVNIRSGPGTGYEQIASREGANQILAADGQFGDISVPENHWWRLYDGFWIRNDQVAEQTRERCAALPVVSAQ